MPNIRHELLIGARPKQVYDAITSHKGLSAWWTPDVNAKPELNSIARFGFGPAYFKEMKIMELEPLTKVKWLCITGAEEWIGTAISFELQPGDKDSLLNAHPELLGQIQQQTSQEGTLVVFHHDNWKEYTPMFAECNYTWAQFLRSLKLLCETGKGRPWPDQHRAELIKGPDFIKLFETYTAIAGKEKRDKHYNKHIAPFLNSVAEILTSKYIDKKIFPHVSNFRTHILFRLGLDKKQTHRASAAISFGDDYIYSGFDLTHALADAQQLRNIIQQRPDEIVTGILKLKGYSIFMPNAGITEAVSIDSLEFDHFKKLLLTYHPRVMRECYCRIDREYNETTLTQEQMISLFDEEYETFRFLIDGIQSGQ